MERDEQKTALLKAVVEANPVGFASMLRSKGYAELRRYVEDWCSGFMPLGMKLSTKCWYAANGLSGWVRCRNCGKPMERDVVSLTRPHLDYCCPECAYESEEFAEGISRTYRAKTPEQVAEKNRKQRETRLRLYGDENFTNRKKAERTCSEKYGEGIVNPAQVPEVKEKALRTMVGHFGRRFTQTPEYRKKTRETCLERYGTEFPSQAEETKLKRRATNEERYGGASPMCSGGVREKSHRTCVEKYGVPYVSQCPEIAERQKAGYARTCEERYGGLRPSETEGVKRKISEAVRSEECQAATKRTNVQRYGVEHVNQDPARRREAQLRYSYGGISFDSKPEIALYIWLRDSGRDFEYQPADREFWYEVEEDNGSVSRHRYFPDFRVGDQYVEIKGGHLLDENGDWTCPWDPKRSARSAAKGRCAKANGVRVLGPAEYARYVRYVEKKYGKGYLDSFKNRKQR